MTLLTTSHRATPHLPIGIGSKRTFYARETEFAVKQLRNDSWCIWSPGKDDFLIGDKTDTLARIEHAMDFGFLPDCHDD